MNIRSGAIHRNHISKVCKEIHKSLVKLEVKDANDEVKYGHGMILELENTPHLITICHVWEDMLKEGAHTVRFANGESRKLSHLVGTLSEATVNKLSDDVSGGDYVVLVKCNKKMCPNGIVMAEIGPPVLNSCLLPADRLIAMNPTSHIEMDLNMICSVGDSPICAIDKEYPCGYSGLPLFAYLDLNDAVGRISNNVIIEPGMCIFWLVGVVMEGNSPECKGYYGVDMARFPRCCCPETKSITWGDVVEVPQFRTNVLKVNKTLVPVVQRNTPI